MALTTGLNFNEKRNKVKLLLIAIFLLYSIMPIVSRLISNYLTTYFYLALIVLMLSLIIFDIGKGEFLKYLVVLIPFLVYSVLMFFARNNSIVLWAYQSLLTILPVCIGMYLKDRNEDYTPLLVFAYIVTLITTIIGCIIYPNASRILATSESSDTIYELTYSIRNIGGFSYVYSCVLMYPLLIFAYKRGKINLFVSLIGTVLIFILCFVTEYAIALLLSIVSTVLYFFDKNTSPKKMFIVFIIAILIVILFSNLFSDLLKYLADNISSKSIADRLNALAGGKAGLESSEDNRVLTYERSISLFLEHPIFGNVVYGIKSIGGHSTILDWLAHYGLLGGFILLWMQISIFNLFYKQYSKKKGYGLVLYCFLLVIGLSLINTGLWLTELCVILPSFLKSIYKEK